jgi:hypothetical protein
VDIVDDRRIASGLALLVDKTMLTVDLRPLLGGEPELYSPAAIERLGRMASVEWIFGHESDPRELSTTAGESDWMLTGRYGRIGRLLEMCREHGVERAVATLAAS